MARPTACSSSTTRTRAPREAYAACASALYAVKLACEAVREDYAHFYTRPIALTLV